jgi:signal transduction histidine kinase
MSAPRRLQIGLAALAVVGGVCTVVVMLGGHHNMHRGVYALLTLGIAWGFTATGLYAWRQSPSANTGPLMIAVGFSGLVKSLAFSNNSTVFAIASIFEVLIYGLLVHLLLSFPAGRLEGSVDRALVVITYINVTVVQVAAFVFSQPSSEGCTRCPTNPISLDHSQAASALQTAQIDIAVALLGGVVAILYLRWRGSSPARRRAVAPVMAVGAVTFVLLMTELVVEQAGVSEVLADRLTIGEFASLACLPLAFLAGLLRSRYVEAEDTAVALTHVNEHLEAELRAKVAELSASRARIVLAGDAERRRIERDLHDGAQQRLMALGINLRLVRGRVAGDPKEAIDLLDNSLQELGEATRELRELARGIHPAVLTDRGLEAALRGLAGRSPVPVELVGTPPQRLPAPVESAVYFVVAEALTNAARYAAAKSVKVGVWRDNGQVEVEVSDDGVGGADPEGGSGLRGLNDRVSALEGKLELDSSEGEGTVVRARIPCG